VSATPPSLLAGRALAGGIAAGVVLVAAGFGSQLLARALGRPELAVAVREFVAQGAWIRVPLAGAAVGAASAAWSSAGRRRALAAGVAVVFGLAAAFLSPAPVTSLESRPIRGTRAKIRAILKGSFQSPAAVARVLELSFDPDPRVREQAVLTLGVNLIVNDVEHALGPGPSRYAGDPLREKLRERLRDAMARDSVESIRAEAAHALWKAPRTFGLQPAAADTLAAVLDRAGRPGSLERLAWLALDAAASPPSPVLEAAARRLAARTPDADLARVARAAADSAGSASPHSL
jgi:hypothetical protein